MAYNKPMREPPELSIIIPAYNEAGNVQRRGLEPVYKYLKTRGGSFELILVDDGSSDNTLALLQSFSVGKNEVIVINAKHRGKGPTVMEGMLKAHGAYRLFTDFDQSTPISEVETLLRQTKMGYDLVIGSREIKGAKRQAEPWHRHIMGKGFNLVVRMLAVHGIFDTQCGFKLLSAHATKTLFPKLQVTVSPKKDAFTGAFDVELLFLARKMGYKIKEVPVTWTHVRSERVSPIKDSLRMFSDVVKIRWQYLLGRYAA